MSVQVVGRTQSIYCRCRYNDGWVCTVKIRLLTVQIVGCTQPKYVCVVACVVTFLGAPENEYGFIIHDFDCV